MERLNINNLSGNASWHCLYESGYEPIYVPTHTISFIFTEEEQEEEYEENDVTPSSSIIIYEAVSKK